MKNVDNSVLEKKNQGFDWILLFVLAVFFLNDFFFMWAVNPWAFFIVDYLFKGFITVWAVLKAAQSPRIRSFFSLPQDKIPMLVLWFLALPLVGVFIDQWVWRWLAEILPRPEWQLYYPDLQGPLHEVFDLTVGVGLVAVAEEFVFRAYLEERLPKDFPSWLRFFIPMALFGLIHWGHGYTAILATFLWGVLPAISVKTTGSLWPAIVAHFITNFVAFSGVLDFLFYG
jgi:membrane protease YdiL (CAAX protease family)